MEVMGFFDTLHGIAWGGRGRCFKSWWSMVLHGIYGHSGGMRENHVSGSRVGSLRVCMGYAYGGYAKRKYSCISQCSCHNLIELNSNTPFFLVYFLQTHSHRQTVRKSSCTAARQQSPPIPRVLRKHSRTLTCPRPRVPHLLP